MKVLEQSRAVTLSVIQEAVIGTRDEVFARRVAEIL